MKSKFQGKIVDSLNELYKKLELMSNEEIIKFVEDNKIKEIPEFYAKVERELLKRNR